MTLEQIVATCAVVAVLMLTAWVSGFLYGSKFGRQQLEQEQRRQTALDAIRAYYSDGAR